MTQQHPQAGGSGGGTGVSIRPGQMTAVMRAMPQMTGPKVLRIGIVQAGKVIEERVIKQRTSVTIGTSEKSMFVVAGKSVPPIFRLFELIGNEYHLNFFEGMGGRVALQTGISDLPSLTAQAKRTPQGAYQVRLTEDSRGKVVVGETTLLFQFVAPPPVQPKPQLPVSVKGGLSSQIDWSLTIIAAFSFLFHFGMVGAVYSDWLDPVVDDETNIAGLIDTVRGLPSPPVVETAQDATDKGPTQATATEAPKTGNPSAGNKGGAAGGNKGMSSGERARLSAQLDRLEMATIGALTGQGTATSGVLRGDVPLSNLDAVAQSGAGVSSNGALGLNLQTGGGGILRPGTGLNGLNGVGDARAGAPKGAGVAQAVAGPQGNANVGASSIAGASVSNAEGVVAKLRAGFRNCYQKGLATNPEMAGSVRIVAKIGPNGEVVSATPQATGLSPDVVDCVVRRVKSAQFAQPEGGGGATITIPVTFVKQ